MRFRKRWLGLTLLLMVGVGSQLSRGVSAESAVAQSPPVVPLPIHKAPGRVVAMGDLHGDVQALRRVLKLARVADDAGTWVGGNTVLVQTGDILDRGDDEPDIITLLESLQKQAQKVGGDVVALNGNHEVMNVEGDLRYVTPGGMSDFAGVHPELQKDLLTVPEMVRGRRIAFAPGGDWARRLAPRPVVAQVGTSIFVHGGLLPEHLDYGLERLNVETRRWMLGEIPQPAALKGDRALIWTRVYGDKVEADACGVLKATLGRVGAKRLVIGHTVQEQGIGSACDGQVWRIDVGLAAHYGGPTQALELVGDQVHVLK